MTENENSPENLRKFLESDDPAMVRMGLSMAKAVGVEITIKDLERFLKSMLFSDSFEAIKTGIMLADEAGFGDEALNILCSRHSCEVIDDPVLVRKELGDEKAIKVLAQMIEWGGDEEARDSAVEQLVDIGGKYVVELLIGLLTPDEQDAYWITESAAIGLGRLGDKRAVESLMGALTDECDREGEWNYETNFSNEMRFIQDDIISALINLETRDNLVAHYLMDCHIVIDCSELIERLEYGYQFEKGPATREEEYIAMELESQGWKPQTDEEKIAYCAAMYPDFSTIIEWGSGAISPLISMEIDTVFLSEALIALTKELEDSKEKDNVMKFLKDKDPALVGMGGSMLKAILEK